MMVSLRDTCDRYAGKVISQTKDLEGSSIPHAIMDNVWVFKTIAEEISVARAFPFVMALAGTATQSNNDDDEISISISKPCIYVLDAPSDHDQVIIESSLQGR